MLERVELVIAMREDFCFNGKNYFTDKVYDIQTYENKCIARSPIFVCIGMSHGRQMSVYRNVVNRTKHNISRVLMKKQIRRNKIQFSI